MERVVELFGGSCFQGGRLFDHRSLTALKRGRALSGQTLSEGGLDNQRRGKCVTSKNNIGIQGYSNSTPLDRSATVRLAVRI